MTGTGIRAVIAGAGSMGRRHADALARAGGTLVAAVDPRLEDARRLAGGGQAVTSLDDVRTHVDVVHMCAPLAEHARLIEQALGLGAHVIAEKPLAPDAATTAALLNSAKERDLVVIPVHQFLFQPGLRRLLSGRDSFGALVRCVFEAHSAGAELTGLDPDELVAEILPHPLALFSRLAPAGISQLRWAAMRPAAGELRAVAEAGGTSFEIAISSRGRPTRLTFDLVGTTASGHADLFHGFAVIERGTGTGLRKVARPFALAGATLGRGGTNLGRRALTREVAYPGLRELVRQTYVAIAAGNPAPIPEREVLDVAEARDAILAATAELQLQE